MKPDLDYPSIYRTNPKRAREIESVARKTEWQRQRERSSLYGALGVAIAIGAFAFIATACVAVAVAAVGR